MRAMVIDSYGDASALHPAEVTDPKVGPDYVLVRVLGAGVNPVDYKTRAGGLDDAFPVHFPMILGWDVSGVVETVGPAARGWKEGDEVIAYARKHYLGDGAYAELIALPDSFLARRPSSVDAVTASGLPLAGLTAWQALADALNVGTGDRVLVHAAGGGVGSFAVQIAKTLGATVVGTASRSSFQRLESLGVDECIDYHAGPVSQQLNQPVDAVLDLVGGDALADSPACLGDSSDGHDRPRLVSIVDPAAVRRLGGTYVFVRPDGDQLAHLAALVDDGRLRIDVDDVLPLDRVAEAHERLEQRHTKGKLVLSV